jgi:hypothetical protein
MTLLVAPIPVSKRLVDTIATLDLAALSRMKNAGAEGIIAYLGGNLTRQLIADATGLGLGLVPVNFAHSQGWIPTAQLGKSDASASVQRLTMLGIPVAGLVDWIDIEGCGADPTDYINAAAQEIAGDGAGRLAGEYVGAGGLLTGAQLWALPKIVRYWHSCSSGIPEPQGGFSLVQLFPPNQLCGGIQVDWDFAGRDFGGRAATWLVSAAAGSVSTVTS